METQFKPTNEMIESAKEVFVKMAWVETVRPIVKEYEKEILARHQFCNDDNEVVLDPALAYRLNDADFKVYVTECNQARIEKGLHVEDEGYCPLLVAEDELRIARNKLIESFEPITHVTHHQLLCNGLDKLEKYIDLTLRLMVTYIGSEKAVRS